LLREAAQSRILDEVTNPSSVGEALARAGNLLVAAGQGLQRRYRRMEEGVALGNYANHQRVGRAL